MNAEKRERLTEALRHGVATVLIDARQPGVDVPDNRRSQELILNLSFRYAPCDLTLSDWGVRSTLSFNGENCPVAVPWEALWGVRSAAAPGVYLWELPAEPIALTKRRGILGLVS